MKLGDQVSIYQLTIKRNAHIEKFNKKQKRMRSQINKEIYTKIREREREHEPLYSHRAEISGKS